MYDIQTNSNRCNNFPIFCVFFRNENASQPTDSRTLVEKKKFDDEIARLRGENELLKAILIKHGINYVKERTSFKTNEYS